MKVLSTLFTIAVLGFSTVFGQNNIAYDGSYIYEVDGNKATLITFRNQKYVRDAVLPPTVDYFNRINYLTQIGPNAFADTELEIIQVNSDVQSLHLSNNAFANAKNLRSVRFNLEKVTADEGAFNNLSPNVDFEGIGCRGLANDIARKLLTKWGLPIGQDFKSVSTYEFKKNLNLLAYNVKKTFRIDNRVAHPDNAVNVFALKAGSSQGIARVFRILARNMGYEYNDVHVGSDDAGHFWNYVFITMNGSPRTWYNLDIVTTDLSSPNYDVSIFRTKEQQKNVLIQSFGSNSKTLDTDNWIILNNEYNYPGEFIMINGKKYYHDTPRFETFYGWCVSSRSGHIA